MTTKSDQFPDAGKFIVTSSSGPGVIAGAIELLSQVSANRTARERIELSTRLSAQLGALEVHVEYELAERERVQLPEAVPLSAHLPGFRVRK